MAKSPVDESSTKATINSGDLVDTIPVTGRADLTDAQWAVLEPLLPKGKKPGRPPKWTKRQLIDRIRRRGRVGSPGRGRPPRDGPGETEYGRLRRRRRDGTWARALCGRPATGAGAGRGGRLGGGAVCRVAVRGRGPGPGRDAGAPSGGGRDRGGTWTEAAGQDRRGRRPATAGAAGRGAAARVVDRTGAGAGDTG